MLSALLFSAVVLSQVSPAMKESLDALATVSPWLSSPDAFRDAQHHQDIARSLIESTGAEDTEAIVAERYVALLRAASYLDAVLRQAPDGPHRAEALYLLGVVHPTVADSPLWQLEWMYFEACIRENPGTPIAGTCAQRLKDRTWYIWHRRADMPAATWAALGELLRTAKSGR